MRTHQPPKVTGRRLARERDLKLLPPSKVPDDVQEKLGQIQDTAATHLRAGKTIKQIADDIGISPNTIYLLRARYPAFRDELDKAAYDGSSAVLEELRHIPFDEENPARARVKVDALCRYLELRWPERFGKRLDVTVKTLDLGDALSKARARAGVTLDAVPVAVIADQDEQDANDFDDLL